MTECELIYDTETTGLVNFKKHLSDPSQPHIVQLAAILIDKITKEVLCSMNFVCKPDGWDIPKEVSDIHGITTEYALDVGISERKVVGMFLSMWNKRFRIAHNESFDSKVISIALTRHFKDDALSYNWASGDYFCTMEKSKNILCLSPTDKMKQYGYGPYKNPKLEEAYEYFMKKPMEDAHDALADVMACRQVYKSLRKLPENLLNT